MKRFCKTHFAFLLIITLLLSGGCAKKTPTESIIDTHVDHIGQVLDYAYNNFDQNNEVVALENELKSCQMVLLDVRYSCNLEVGKCEANRDYWKLATFGLFIALIGVISLMIKRLIK